MGTRFDDSRFPVLLVEPVGQATDDEVEARIAWFRSYLGGERFALIMDTLRSEALTARQRKLYTDWLMADRGKIERDCAGCAVVVSSPLVRGAFTSVFWFWTPPMPCVFFATLDEAIAWSQEQLNRPA